MKIKIDYNLIDKIYEAKGEYKLKRTLITAGKATSKYLIISALAVPIMGTLANYSAEQIIIETAKYMGLYYGIGLLAIPITNKLTTKFNNASIEELAMKDLKTLSSQLKQLDINTNSELLLESKEYHQEHKINLTENSFPSIIQKKYINIPTTHNTEVSIVQEHQIGSKQYVLSLGSPTRVKSFQMAYGI